MTGSSVRLFACTGAVAALLAVGGAARADVVSLGKRDIHGQILEEDDEKVVIRVGSGTLTLPRKQVTAVRREDEVATLLGEARELVRSKDAKALGAFERAAAAARKRGENDRATAIDKERTSVTSKVDARRPVDDPEARAVAARAEDARAASTSPFLLEADLDEVRVQVQGFREGRVEDGTAAARTLVERAQGHLAKGVARWAVGAFALAREVSPASAVSLWSAERTARARACGQAIADKDAKLARQALAPLVKETPSEPRVAYLEGRTDEVGGAPAEAKEAYGRILDSVPNARDLPVDWLRELAKQRVLGKTLGPASAGVGATWRKVETVHFNVYHDLGDAFTSEEVSGFEAARAAALERLGLADSGTGRVPLFLYKDKGAYLGDGGPEWAGAHVATVTFDDGPSRTIYAFPGRRAASDVSTIQHELAHVLVDEAFPELRTQLPMWAIEGVATHAEPDASRTARRQGVARALAAGTFVPLKSFLSRVTLDDSDRSKIGVFYEEACVVFTRLVEKTGGVGPALKLASRIVKRGVDAALAEIGTDASTLEGEVRASLGR